MAPLTYRARAAARLLRRRQAQRGQATFGVEIDLGKLGGTNADNNSYSMLGLGTFVLVVASGGSTGVAYEDATFGIAADERREVESGLIFRQRDRRNRRDNRVDAIQMAKGHVVGRLTPEGLQGASIKSVATENAKQAGIELRNDGVRFTKSGSTIFTVHRRRRGTASATFVNLLAVLRVHPRSSSWT